MTAQGGESRKRVYIAGKISGTDDYLHRFAAAENFLSRRGYDAVNPAKVADSLPSPSTTYRNYIQLGLLLLDTCDAVFALRGWERSVGASLELQYAKALGKEILFEEDFEHV